jgi:hypothetical protein
LRARLGEGLDIEPAGIELARFHPNKCTVAGSRAQSCGDGTIARPWPHPLA